MATIPQEHRLLPAAVDYRASADPESTFAFLPKGDSPEDGFEPLSYGRYAKAVDEVAWWLDDYLDGPVKGDDFPTVAYVGPNDLRYSIIILAAAKTKRKVLLPFPANTVISQTNLLKSSKCQYVVFGIRPSPDWNDTLSLLPHLKRVQLPEVATLLHDRPIQHYKYPKSYDEGIDDPLYVIQTSGTTGNPKPIVITNRNDIEYLDTSAANANAPADSKLALVEFTFGNYYPSLLPLSWIAGIAPLLEWSVTYNMKPILMPATMPQPMTAAYLTEALKAMPRGARNGIYVTPDTLKEVARDPVALEQLRGLDVVGYAGAPLDHETGDIISEYTRVQSLIGATDTGTYPILVSDPADWKLLRFHPSLLGFHFEHFNDDTYELCIYRQPHDPRYCFQVNPDIDNYHTKDLFRKVPGRDGFWQNAGRIDDFVKLATMTKFSATAIEQIIDRHPQVLKSLVGGDARDRTFAIVQPRAHNGRSAREIVDELWPAFEAANKLVFGEAQLTKDLVLVTEPDLPIKQTAKGSVDRRTTLARYEAQVEKLYQTAGFAALPAGADRTIR